MQVSRSRTTVRLAMVLVASVFVTPLFAGGTLDLPVTDAFGDPIDVGFMVVGHSTSEQGDWPAKFVETVNGDPNDGRNYVKFPMIKNGDGGFLWTQVSFLPTDLQYDRVLSSADNGNQHCEDSAGVRWSCRRMRLERALTGQEPASPDCAPPNNTCTPRPVDCVWHENGQQFDEPLGFFQCWEKMDVRLAAIQDSSNRSLPVDDNDRDGDLDGADGFLASDVPSPAWPCNGTSGVVGDFLDWDCDGQYTANDSSRKNYADWLESLADDLVNDFGPYSVDHVFVSQKPCTMFACGYFEGEPQCDDHVIREPTPARPYDHYWRPTAYWEHAVVDEMFSRPTRDPRVHRATPNNVRELWEQTAHCYRSGFGGTDWHIPQTWTSRPTSVAADDSEDDEVNSEDIGCYRFDHRHHTPQGGWVQADVWYAGLRPYLQDFNPPVAAASDPSVGLAPMTVAGFDKVTGEVMLSYQPACKATDHAIHSGPLAAVGSYGYDSSSCGYGTSGSMTFDPGTGDRFFLLAGRDGYSEGSLGLGDGGERPAPAAGPGVCYLPQVLGGTCP